jgi:hypothetical protein
VRFVRESMSNRLNDEQSAIVVIMQRLGFERRVRSNRRFRSP